MGSPHNLDWEHVPPQQFCIGHCLCFRGVCRLETNFYVKFLNYGLPWEAQVIQSSASNIPEWLQTFRKDFPLPRAQAETNFLGGRWEDCCSLLPLHPKYHPLEETDWWGAPLQLPASQGPKPSLSVPMQVGDRNAPRTSTTSAQWPNAQVFTSLWQLAGAISLTFLQVQLYIFKMFYSIF